MPGLEQGKKIKKLICAASIFLFYYFLIYCAGCTKSLVGRLSKAKFVAPDEHDLMREFAEVGQHFDSLLYAVSDAERGREQHRYHQGWL